MEAEMTKMDAEKEEAHPGDKEENKEKEVDIGAYPGDDEDDED